jgi:hypothetical protein
MLRKAAYDFILRNKTKKHPWVNPRNKPACDKNEKQLGGLCTVSIPLCLGGGGQEVKFTHASASFIDSIAP